MNINKVAVIGAGVMGAGIAAHISNTGTSVYLLDIVPENSGNRNIIAETAIKHLLKSSPPAFMDKKNARLITPGNIEDNLDWLTDADWVIEAVIEDPDIKQSLYRKLIDVCNNNTIISSNTSTLPLKILTEGMPNSFRQQFLISHFFNPPRYMRLLELVADSAIRPELLDAVSEFTDIKLGKGCVRCKDTPGFIANRIGIYWIQCGLLEAIRLGLTVEEADAVISAPFGIPKTGIFGLLDLVGLDLMPHIMKSMEQALAPEDAFHQINTIPPLVSKMIADGYTGRKGKGGFYRLNKQKGQRIKESIDLISGEYSASTRVKLDSVKAAQKQDIQVLFEFNDKTSQFAWQVMAKTILYAASLIPEIANDPVAIDQAIRLGFNWQKGPFELLDQIGKDWFVKKAQKEGYTIPELLKKPGKIYKVSKGERLYLDLSGSYQPVPKKPGIITLSDVKLKSSPVLSNASASLWDIGNGIACLEFHSKMNTLDMDSMALMQQSIEKVKQEFSGLIIHNEADNFSAGANLGLLMMALQQQNWEAVSNLIRQGQQTYQALKYAPFPVVAAPSGLALGGGCEILLHCDAIQAHAELYTGLVEVSVGLIPGWGGCKEYLRRQMQNPKRFGGPIPPITKAFETIGMAKVSQSAFEAQQWLFLSQDDGITMNKDRLLTDAKAKAQSLSENYSPPEPFEYRLPGKTAKILLTIATKAFHAIGKISNYDLEVSEQLAYVLSGGDCDISTPLTEQDISALELEAFLHLVKQPGTVARLQHMLKTGKPLRN
jgi:3-hydroxyacyl-CoA dehydrogenase